MAPIARGYCLYESLQSGAVTLFDIARMNDHIAVVLENQRRAQEK